MTGLKEFIVENLNTYAGVKYFKSSTTMIPEISDLEYFKSQFSVSGSFTLKDYENILGAFNSCLKKLSVFKNNYSDLMDYIYMDFYNLIYKGEYIFQTINFCESTSINYPNHVRKLQRVVQLNDDQILLLNKSLNELEIYLSKLKPYEFNISKSKVLNSWYEELLNFVKTVKNILKEIIINQEKRKYK